MARAKIKRGSTSIDMTPMCDVAFLLLTFFILAAQFKPDSAIEVVTPTSVSNKVAAQKDFMQVTISKDNKVFMNMDPAIKKDVLTELGKERNINFSQDDINRFVNGQFVGVPINQLKQFDQLDPSKIRGNDLPGIPVDSTNNELQAWISAIVTARMGKKMNYLIKGDSKAKYSTFKQVIDAFEKNDQYKYYLVTSSENIPEGSELFKKNLEEQLHGKSPSTTK